MPLNATPCCWVSFSIPARTVGALSWVLGIVFNTREGGVKYRLAENCEAIVVLAILLFCCIFKDINNLKMQLYYFLIMFDVIKCYTS